MNILHTQTRGTGGRGWPLSRLPLAVALVALPLAGCENLLEVEDPATVTRDDTRDPANLPAVHAAALSDFAFSFTGTGNANANEGVVLTMGILSDELKSSDTFPTRTEVDRRDITVDNATMQTVFRNLSNARRQAEDAAAAFAAIDPDSLTAGQVGQHAEVLSLAGFATVHFGEKYCSGVPFSNVTDAGELEHGPPLSTQEIFERAITRFDEAIAVAAEGSAMENLARVGKARAELNLGRFAAAATTAAEVPDGFVYEMEHSNTSARQRNGVWQMNHITRRFAMTNRHGGNGLPYREDGIRLDEPTEANPEEGGSDPRITYDIHPTQPSFDGSTTMWRQGKYTAPDDNAVLASGIEARLIQAEAALPQNGGSVGAFLEIHNTLRAGIGLDALVAGDLGEAGLVDLHFRERAYWMWLTAHRLGDMRRLIRQYERNSEAVFPTGDYFKPGNYGTATNFPIPFDEQNNPNFEQCLERDDSAVTTS